MEPRPRPSPRGAGGPAGPVDGVLPRVLGTLGRDVGVPGPPPGQVRGRRRVAGEAVRVELGGLRLSRATDVRPGGPGAADARPDGGGADPAEGRPAVPLQARIREPGRRAMGRGALADAARVRSPGRSADEYPRGLGGAHRRRPDRGERRSRAPGGVRLPLRDQGRPGDRPAGARGGPAAHPRGTGRPGPAARLRRAGPPRVPPGLPANHASGTSGHGARVLRGGPTLTPTGEPLVPRYGEGTLSDLVPSVLAALGLPGFDNPLGIDPLVGVCVLVVDGMGWESIRSHREDAPFLAAASDSAAPITAGFPSTTSASLGSLGTGLPPGQHGLVGYTFAVPGLDRPMNSLLWQPYGIGSSRDLRDELVPEEVQPEPTVVERAAAAGMEMLLIGPAGHLGSGLTRAILRGGRYVGADTLEELVLAVATAFRDGRSSVYAYHPFLDTYGHLAG